MNLTILTEGRNMIADTIINSNRIVFKKAVIGDEFWAQSSRDDITFANVKDLEEKYNYNHVWIDVGEVKKIDESTIQIFAETDTAKIKKDGMDVRVIYLIAECDKKNGVFGACFLDEKEDIEHIPFSANLRIAYLILVKISCTDNITFSNAIPTGICYGYSEGLIIAPLVYSTQPEILTFASQSNFKSAKVVCVSAAENCIKNYSIDSSESEEEV